MFAMKNVTNASNRRRKYCIVLYYGYSV